MMTKEKYCNIASSRSKRTKLPINIIKAFLIGGVICLIAHGFLKLYEYLGADFETARTCSTLTIIFLAGLLTGLGVFDDLARHGGGGTLVPITGFSNSVTSPAIESKSEGFINGVGAKMFVIAGPVIVYGVCASVIYGMIYYFFM
jgi:stage V sporulation protein AC